jgi:hypothetical protein
MIFDIMMLDILNFGILMINIMIFDIMMLDILNFDILMFSIMMFDKSELGETTRRR